VTDAQKINPTPNDIIASSSANTTDSALKDRIKEMKEAVETVEHHQYPDLYFYDRMVSS